MLGRRSALLLALAVGGCGAGVAAPALQRHAARAPQRSARPAPPPPPTVHLTVEVNGDLLIHAPVWRRAVALGGGRRYDFAPMLRQVRPWIRGADLAVCHVETPMTPGPPAGYPSFNTPPALARAIHATGWDACDTASNHTLDRGQRGVDATIRALERNRVRHTGSASSARGARRILMLRARGVRIAYLAYTATTNGLPRPHPWSVNLARAGRILRDARRARTLGAQAVFVNLHWGTEERQAPDAAQLGLARRLVRSRAITAVVGQHVHVVQPIRRVRGTWVVFGEGNLLSNQTAACCSAPTQDGMLVILHLAVTGDRSRVERIDYVPVWVRHPDFTVVPVGYALRRGAGPRAELRASWRRTLRVVGRSATLRPLPRRVTR